MHDAASVTVIERLGGLDADLDHLVERPRPVGEEGAQRAPLDDRHDEEERALVVAEVVDGDDRRVVEPRDELRLALEALASGGADELRRHQLDRHVARQHGVAGAVDDAHAAAPELADDGVAAGKAGADHARAPVIAKK